MTSFLLGSQVRTSIFVPRFLLVRCRLLGDSLHGLLHDLCCFVACSGTGVVLSVTLRRVRTALVFTRDDLKCRSPAAAWRGPNVLKSASTVILACDSGWAPRWISAAFLGEELAEPAEWPGVDHLVG